MDLRCSSSVSLSSLAVSLAADLCLLVAEATGSRGGAEGGAGGGAEGGEGQGRDQREERGRGGIRGRGRGGAGEGSEGGAGEGSEGGAEGGAEGGEGQGRGRGYRTMTVSLKSGMQGVHMKHTFLGCFNLLPLSLCLVDCLQCR